MARHAKIVAAGEPFLEARARLEAVMKEEKAKVDLRRLAAIEQHEGRSANWHVANVMLRARHVIDALPSGRNPVVDVAVFDAAIADYAAAVKEMDAFGAGKPNTFFVFESQPRALLGKLLHLQANPDPPTAHARPARAH